MIRLQQLALVHPLEAVLVTSLTMRLRLVRSWPLLSNSCSVHSLQQRLLANQSYQSAASAEDKQRVLTVAIVGLPNAGKSTLVNRLIGKKISGVSSKRNTTISTQLGSFTVGNSQVLLYDTPGLVEHHVQGSPLERLRNAWSTAAMADQLLFIVDAERQVSSQGSNSASAVSQLL